MQTHTDVTSPTVEQPNRSRTAIIAKLNDDFRQGLLAGRKVMTRGVQSKGDDFVAQADVAVALFHVFNEFTPDNDPHGEHDFGAFEIDGQKLFWKIDYYDRQLEYGSDDPTDPDVTTRVLTMMLASEY